MFEGRSIMGRLYFALGIILAIASIAIGILLAIGTNLNAWIANPLLLGWFTRFFVPH